MWSTKHMSESFAEGMIHLIPKGIRETQNIQNWRPITIFSTRLIRSIDASVLARRIKRFMLDLIQINKTGFMLDRSILTLMIFQLLRAFESFILHGSSPWRPRLSNTCACVYAKKSSWVSSRPPCPSSTIWLDGIVDMIFYWSFSRTRC